MSHPDAAMAPALYDHEQELAPQREAPDWGGDDLFAAAPRRRFARRSLSGDESSSSAGPPAVGDGGAPAPPATAAPRPAALISQEPPSHPVSRRTVLVTGRPDRAAWAGERQLAASRRRPSRTVDERLAGRPDRVAGWAFALGLLLILVAVSTADAAPL